MTYEQEATELMKMPAFIAAKDAYITAVLPVRDAMRKGRKPTPATLRTLSGLERAMRETTGLAAYKKTWKIIESRITSQYTSR